jgi:DNA modification methylase
MQVEEPFFDYISSDVRFEIKNDDCLSVLKQTNGGKYDLVLTSPPYNVGKS